MKRVFRLKAGVFGPWLVGPAVFGVSAFHVFDHIAPRSAPESGQIKRGLDRLAPRRSEQKSQGLGRIAKGGVAFEAEQCLHPHLDARPPRIVIIDGMRAARRAAKFAGHQPVERLLPIPAQPVEQSLMQRPDLHRIKPPF